jgi:IS5 family transposase
MKTSLFVQYGHKINLATDTQGLVLYLGILDGNPGDKVLYKPVIDYHQNQFGQVPHTTVADGGYASLQNVTDARAEGVVRAAFHKRAGLGYHVMGLKKKTLASLRAFRAGIEGNISELKRAFGLSKARWKNKDGFHAFVWSGVLSYNLVRMVRISTA